MKFKLYDYTNLLNVVKEVDLENEKLKNVKEMGLKNKCIELEYKLLNSGILEDWAQLNKLGTNFMRYDRFDNSYLNSAYNNNYINLRNKAFMYYDNGIFGITMSSGSYWHDSLYIAPRRSSESGKVVWDISHSTSHISFDGFKDNEFECKIKILMIETLIATYEDYRNYALEKFAEKMGRKIEESNKLKKEIEELI